MLREKGSAFKQLSLFEQHRILVRWLFVLCVVGWGLVIVLVVVSAVLASTTKVEPIYVEFTSGGNNFVVVSRGNQNLSGRSVVVHAALRDYVVQRESLDAQTETIRYPKVYAMTAADARRVFMRNYTGENFPEHMKGVHRTVVVMRDASLSATGDGGIHQVGFRTIDLRRDPGGRVSVEKADWVATMEYVLSAQEMVADEVFLNPTGLLVRKYELKQSRDLWKRDFTADDAESDLGRESK